MVVVPGIAPATPALAEFFPEVDSRAVADASECETPIAADVRRLMSNGKTSVPAVDGVTGERQAQRERQQDGEHASGRHERPS